MVVQYGISGSIFNDTYNLYNKVKCLRYEYKDTPVFVTITIVTPDRTYIMTKDIDGHCVETYDNFKWILDEAVALKLGRKVYDSLKGGDVL